MKREYTRPDILFEDFSMSTAIAGICGEKTNTPSAEQCGFDFGGDMVFVSGIIGCEVPITDGSINDGLCYHVPVGSNRLFNS